MCEKRPTRKGCTPIYVYCLPEEKAQIEGIAKATGYSASSYLRVVGQGYPVHSILDYEHVQELAKINGDLGRVGGLLKLWLTDDAKLATFRHGADEQDHRRRAGRNPSQPSSDP